MVPARLRLEASPLAVHLDLDPCGSGRPHAEMHASRRGELRPYRQASPLPSGELLRDPHGSTRAQLPYQDAAARSNDTRALGRPRRGGCDLSWLGTPRCRDRDTVA